MKRYQAVAFLLSTAMTVSSVAPVFGASNDVFGHWAEFTITKWQNEGRIGGYEDGTFKPDKSITRAEFVRLLNSAVPTAFTSSSSVNFSDVKESDWFFADVSKAVGSGVTSGFEDGTFRPGETVTRMQAAVFIAKAKGLTPNEAAADNFTDVASIPAWAKGAVGAAVSAGYLSGYPDGSFGGSKGMTRAEAVSTLDRVLGGTSTSNQTPSTGEVDTTDRDSQEKEETPTTANAGDMVWTSGGSGGGRRSSSSSSGGSSSSSSNTVNGAVTIRSQSDANDYKGKVLTGKATIYAKDGLELNDIKFKGDVDIIADSTATAAAYIDGDTAVAAAYLSDIKIYFEGRTNVSGTITVIRDGVPHTTQVVIITRTPRAISAALKAFRPTRIVGFEIGRVEASAPIEVAKDAKVGTVTADDGASVVAEGDVDNVNVVGKVDNIELSGTGSTDVTVDDGASVEKIDVKDDVKANVEVNGNAEVKNVAVSGNASAGVDVKDNATVGNVAVSDSAAAKVDVKDTAKVEKVDIADSATANVDVAPEAKVDTVTSTSTAAGSTVTGEGEVGKIESTNPGTIEKGEEVTTPVETPPTTDEPSTPSEPVTPAEKTYTIKATKDGTAVTDKVAENDEITLAITETLAEGVSVTYTVTSNDGTTDAEVTVTDNKFTVPTGAKTIKITGTVTGEENAKVTPLSLTVEEAGGEEGPTKEQLQAIADSKLASFSIAAAVGATKADLTTTITTKATEALKGTGLEGWTVVPTITAGLESDDTLGEGTTGEASLTVSYTITKDDNTNSPIEVTGKTVTVTIAGSEAEAAAKNELQVLTIPEFAADATVNEAAVVRAIKEAAKAKIENNAALNGYTLADPVVAGFDATATFPQPVNVTYTFTNNSDATDTFDVTGTVEVKKATADELDSATATADGSTVTGLKVGETVADDAAKEAVVTLDGATIEDTNVTDTNITVTEVKKGTDKVEADSDGAYNGLKFAVGTVSTDNTGKTKFAIKVSGTPAANSNGDYTVKFNIAADKVTPAEDTDGNPTHEVPEGGIAVELTFTVAEADPKVLTFEAAATPNSITKTDGGSVTIKATVKENNVAKQGVDVTFALSSGQDSLNASTTLDETSAVTTDSNGEATATLTIAANETVDSIKVTVTVDGVDNSQEVTVTLS